MKRIKRIIVIIFSLSILLISCTKKENDWAKDVKPFPKINMFNKASTVQENENSIFYINYTGSIYRIRKESYVSQRILKSNNVNRIYLDEQYLYYSVLKDGSTWEVSQIERINLKTGKRESIFSQNDIPDVLGQSVSHIEDFIMYQDILYVAVSGTCIISFDLESHKASVFEEDADSCAFVDDYLYFSPHSTRDYTIWRRSTLTGEVELVRGVEGMEDYSTWYKPMIDYEGDLYLSYGVHDEENEQKDTTYIAKFSKENLPDKILFEIKEANNYLFFAKDLNTIYFASYFDIDLPISVYAYNPISEVCEKIIQISNLSIESGYIIIDNVMFYYEYSSNKTEVNMKFTHKYLDLPIK